MPRQRHGRRHSVVTCGTGVKPPKPGVSRYVLKGFAYPIPILLSIPAFSHDEVRVRGRSGPDEGLPEVGAYLRVSGPSGPLTSAYSEHPARRLTAMTMLSYNIHN